MPKFEDSLETVYAASRAEWRQWLTANHRTYQGVWLVYYKVRSPKPSIRYSDAVKEALCFGWIDSKVKTLDDERYQQIFTPRKPKSVWSKLNKQYVEELVAQGLMTDAGLEKITAAQQNQSWFALDEVEALVIPEDLAQALSADERADRNFAEFNPSTKKNVLFWISSAKRPDTRLRRINQTIEAAIRNQSPL